MPFKILIVEDHRDSCLWISAVLRQRGYQTAEAEDGTVAMRMLRSENPDLILLDMHLPAGGGEFVLENMKRQECFQHIPVIIMSGEVGLDRDHLRELGAVDVLQKPVDVHAFLQLIRNTLTPGMETTAQIGVAPSGVTTAQIPAATSPGQVPELATM